jgi:hypothetical protein
MRAQGLLRHRPVDHTARLAPGTRRLIVLWVLGALLLFKPWVHGTDPAGYFSWLRSAVVDGDLDTTTEFGALVANQLRVVGVVLERLESLLAARFETPA